MNPSLMPTTQVARNMQCPEDGDTKTRTMMMQNHATMVQCLDEEPKSVDVDAITTLHHNPDDSKSCNDDALPCYVEAKSDDEDAALLVIPMYQLRF